MNRKIILLIALFIFSFAVIAAAQGDSEQEVPRLDLNSPLVPDPGEPDTVWVPSLTLPLGTTEFNLELHVYNDEELGGFNLPITWDSPDITCDTVIFTGSRVDYLFFKQFTIDNANRMLQAGVTVTSSALTKSGARKWPTYWPSISASGVSTIWLPPGVQHAHSRSCCQLGLGHIGVLW